MVPLTTMPVGSWTAFTMTSATARAELLTGGSSLAGRRTARKICVSAVCAESDAMKNRPAAEGLIERSAYQVGGGASPTQVIVHTDEKLEDSVPPQRR